MNFPRLLIRIWDMDHGREEIANRRKAIAKIEGKGQEGANKDKDEDEGVEQVGILAIEVFLQGHLLIILRDGVDPLPLSFHHGVEVGVAGGGGSGRGRGQGRGGALTQDQEHRTGEQSEHDHEEAEGVQIIIQHFTIRSHGNFSAKIRE